MIRDTPKAFVQMRTGNVFVVQNATLRKPRNRFYKVCGRSYSVIVVTNALYFQSTLAEYMQKCVQ